ncbi:SRPBCC domain-containing protein [Luteolibacter sp. Populi]|uniref:SRPBCC domain-containing protein n=1 Tax=Luteolibacter sp. Populi TaxID=3230487 RepID=UPI003465E5AA
MSSTRNSKFIRASQEALYRALTDPSALEVWQAPGDMTGRVHEFDLRVGGGYEMSLFYPPGEDEALGKTSEGEDRFTARFVELVPLEKIVEAIVFNSADPAFSGEMIVEITLEAEDDGTRVTYLFRDIPPGIRPGDNEEGTRMTLEKLARYVEGQG